MNGESASTVLSPELLDELRGATDVPALQRKLAEYLGLEKLLSDVSARLLGAADAAQLDQELADAQRRICEFLGLDTSLLALDDGAGQRTHSLHLRADLPRTTELRVEPRHFPWFTRQIEAGQTVAVAAVDELPPEAAVDAGSCRRFGIQSLLAYPLLDRGARVLGSLTFSQVSAPRRWEPDLVERLRLFAQLVAGALARRRAEQTQREGEARFRALSEHSMSGVYMIQDARIIYANAAGERLYGYGPGGLLGKTPLEITHPDDRPKVLEAISRRLDGGEQSVRYQVRGLRSDGTTIDIEVWGTRIEWQGRPALVGNILDISEREQSRRQLAESRALLDAVLDSTDDFIWSVDAETFALLSFNRSISRFSVTAGGVPLRAGMSPEEMMPSPAIAARWREYYRRALHEGPYTFELETEGIDRTLRVSLNVLRREDRAFGLSLFARDVTNELRQARELERSRSDLEQLVAARTRELASAKEAAEQANTLKSAFLAHMSHEVRTPMNAVLGLAHLALKADPPPKQREYLRKILSSGHHLLGIINDILDFSKIESGKLTFETVEFELDALLAEVAGLVAERAAQKKLELILEVAPEVPWVLFGDPLRLTQVLVNFANNAVKFTERGEITVRVEQVEAHGPEATLRFSVADTGIGMSPEQRQHLFNAFEQGSQATARLYGGTGLGLAISKQLAERMHGEVGVESEQGRGSTFWFTARLGVGVLRSIVAQRPLEPLRVLLVDAHAATRDAVGAMVRGLGSSLETANSTSEALRRLSDRQQPPVQLLLIDARLHDSDGSDAARSLARISPRPRIFVLTSGSSVQVLDAVERAYVEGTLTKPLTRTALRAALAGMQLPSLDIRRAPVTEPVPIPTAPTAPPVNPLNGARVLLVEDNELNQQVATELLVDLGAKVTVAENGAVGVELARRDAFALVLMDVEMPVMDGFAATRAIRRLPGKEQLPIIAMTANAMVGDKERCLAAGMDDHLAKPVDPELMARKLAQWLRRAPAPPPAPPPPTTPPQAEPETKLHRVREVDGLDVTLGLKQVLGKEPLYLSLLRKFVQGQRDVEARYLAALEAGDWSTAERTAHTLKGNAGQIGAGELRRFAEQLERVTRERAELPTLRNLASAVGGLVRLLVEALEEALPGPDAPKAAAATTTDAAAVTTCDRLEALLSEDDFGAAKLLAEEEGALRKALGAGFDELAGLVDRCEFGAALAQLKALRAPRR